jgi:hypothetical protein
VGGEREKRREKERERKREKERERERETVMFFPDHSRQKLLVFKNSKEVSEARQN